jgi:hypothetical protein
VTAFLSLALRAENVKLILSGRYRSPTGMGVGLMGARRLVDQFQIDSAPGKGTTIHLRKFLPRGVPARDADGVDAADLLADALRRAGRTGPVPAPPAGG